MDPISTLSGLVDAAAFVDGSTTASATKVTAELAQLLNKTNEIIGGLTVVAGDLDTEEAARATLAGRVTTAESDITAAENNILDHGDRITALEASAASYGTTLYGTGGDNITLTEAQCRGNRIIVASGTGTLGIYLPHDQDLNECQPITFLNESSSFLSIGIDGAASRWGDDSSGFLALTARQYVTLVPMPHPTEQGEFRWFILAGSVGYGDIT